jgi:putative transposase
MSGSNQEKIATFRFGVIAALVCRGFENRLQKEQVRKEILNREWKFPDGGTRKVSPRTLRHWLQRYRQYGLDGLYDSLRKSRRSKGRFRAIPAETLKRAHELCVEVPGRSAETIKGLLEVEAGGPLGFSVRSLQRHLKRIDARRPNAKKELHERWEQLYANDMWHGDTAHGVWLPDPHNPNEMKRTKLIIFVDDASRMCTHGEFYFDEKLPSLIDTFSKAVLQRGKPKRLLLDNAFIFHSTTLEVMCAELETELSFCRPRRPQGKGKVERLIRTVREGFMNEANRAGFTNVEELNQAFLGWLDMYHRREHSELKQTPLARWQQDVTQVQAVTPEHIRRALMLRATRKVQEQTGILYLDGHEYACAKEVAGKSVEARWHVDEEGWIEVWYDGKFVEIAHLHKRPTTMTRSILQPEEEQYPTLDSAKQRMERMRQTSSEPKARMRGDEYLTKSEFLRLFSRYLERVFTPIETEKLETFFNAHAPMLRRATEEAVEKAISVKGNALHIRYYLEHLEAAIRKGRK